MRTLRRRFRNRFRKQEVTVWITADASKFISQLLDAQLALTKVAAAIRKRSALDVHLEQMRELGRSQMAVAHNALDRHVDGIYTDLGLVRDSHIERGQD